LSSKNEVIRFASTAIRSFYRQDMRAIGRKLLVSEVSSFLWIRLVVAVFHSVGTSFAMKQWRNILERISHLGSRRRRWQYSRRSLPGAELDIERSLLESSSGEGGVKREWSVSAEGTKEASSSRRWVVSQGRGPKVLVKYSVASSIVPL
jgi:hypothetical protein